MPKKTAGGRNVVLAAKKVRADMLAAAKRNRDRKAAK